MSDGDITWIQFKGSTAQVDAQTYCNSQTALMVLPSGGVTQDWATPTLLSDGSYVVPEYIHTTGIIWSSDWEIAAPVS